LPEPDGSIRWIVNALAVDRPYPPRLLPLACLTPAIVEAIVRGEALSRVAMRTDLQKAPRAG
jgi:hypothetical protein